MPRIPSSKRREKNEAQKNELASENTKDYIHAHYILL
jgi:hypothetical protein